MEIRTWNAEVCDEATVHNKMEKKEGYFWRPKGIGTVVICEQ